MADWLATLNDIGESIEDASEETFWLFSQDRPQHDLGMYNGREQQVSISIGTKEYEIKQSPALLNSNRSGGTTGAVVWNSTVLLSTWFARPDNCLFRHGLLSSNANIVELGTGVAGLLPLVLSQRVGAYLATDQSYTIKMLQSNIEANLQSREAKGRSAAKAPAPAKIRIAPLDWELDDTKSFLSSMQLGTGVDLVIASDCVYNYHLVEPLVQACREICESRDAGVPTLCLVAQQLRQPDVMEEWLEAFHRDFAVWRLRDEVLAPQMGVDKGFAVHVGVLRNSLDGSKS